MNMAGFWKWRNNSSFLLNWCSNCAKICIFTSVHPSLKPFVRKTSDKNDLMLLLHVLNSYRLTMRLRYLLTLLIGVLFSLGASAQQPATIRGTVYNDKTGEAMPFVLVFLQGTQYGVQTDINGFFSLTKVPSGTYTLAAQTPGYEFFKMEIIAKPGQIITQNITLITKLQKEVIISAEKQEKKENVEISSHTMDQKEINQVPSIGGIADIAQSVQVLPGVISTGDQGGQLYIRGGAPIQNKVLLDGMIIYNPFHSIGLFSVFDTDIIKNFDVYTVGFNADYGG
ncbi:MAG: beta-sandwich domain-containing protein, partial [Bacteroidia bacterium]